MKIIEAQVKIPATAVVSSELKNVILWLLQKDPNTRPSIKDVLNEVRPSLQRIFCTQFSAQRAPSILPLAWFYVI
jgi:serine/threonine protein kinase